MKEVLAVFIGGGLGSLLRFGLGRFINLYHNLNFPLATLIINILACFLLGFILGYSDQKQQFPALLKLFLLVGFCGGFSTFSAFSNETLQLLQNGFTITMLTYILLSVVFCVSVTYLGVAIGFKS